MSEDGSYHYKEVSINEAAEMVAKGETVYLGKPAMYDGERCIYGVNCGGAKVQQKRADKFAAVGVLFHFPYILTDKLQSVNTFIRKIFEIL